MKQTHFASILWITLFLLAGMTAIQAQFKKAEIDSSASYAIRMTLGEDGEWKARETFKVCPLTAAVKGKRGESIKYAVVAVTRECPK